jgi:hypothetical protein
VEASTPTDFDQTRTTLPSTASAGGGRGPGPGAPLGSSPSSDLISIDALQEIRVQTSSFAPEFGRSPGAQVSMTSRGGSNSFHGSLFHYFRNDGLNAQDWFANASSLSRTAMRQNRPGGTFGGPVVKNRIFFFASYEGLRLTTPSTILSSVPDIRSRQEAPASLRPFLNAFPIPNGANLEDQAAEFRAVTTNPSSSDSGSIRLDQVLSDRTTVFARFSSTPSQSESRGAGLASANSVSRRDSRSKLYTFGWTHADSRAALHDLRVNYSYSDSRSYSWIDEFGGAVPLSAAQVLPRGVSADDGEFNLLILGAGSYSIGSRSRSEQSQFNGVYSYTKTASAHTLKLGVDYRQILPTIHQTPYSQSVTFNGMAGEDGALLSGVATNAQVSSSLNAVYPRYTNFSTYWQDTWRASERTTLTYGLRWDVNPAPGTREGPAPLALAESSIAGVTQNEPLYQTRWLDLAPRIGLAYQMDTTPGREVMLRMGLGLFYDVGYGVSAGAFAGAPYSNVRTISAATFPLGLSDASAPPLPPTRPYGQLTAAETTLKSPMVPQWNVTVERYFTGGQLLSVAYVGNQGRRLMRTESRPSFSDAYSILRVATNGATSDYHGLQVQYRRRFASRLQTQVSYTWGHAIDSSSNDLGLGGGLASLFGAGERGSSDYDVRHNLNFSGSYRLIGGKRGWVNAILGDWFADWMLSARTGLPFDVQGISQDPSGDSSAQRNLRQGLFAQVRADYTGQPVWISDSNAPGGRRLNPDAFEAPEGFTQGNLGRNALRGFGAVQADVTLRRQWAISETWRLHLSAQAFNVLNTPSFANPSPTEGANLASPNFGLMTRTLNQAAGGGSNSIYRNGGARQIELVLRLQF